MQLDSNYTVYDTKVMNNNVINNKSNFRGVSYDSRFKKYRVSIGFASGYIDLGLYNTSDEAIAVRLDAEKQFFETFKYIPKE